MEQPPTFHNFETERLFVRKLSLSDVNEVAALRSDEKVNKYIGRKGAVTIAEAFINKIEDGINIKGWFYWALALKADDKLIGTICYWNIDNENSIAEIGYEITPAQQGKGLMQEAIAMVVAYGFNVLKFKKIVAEPNSANGKSIKLLERNGFVAEGFQKSEYVIYYLESPIWQA